MDWEILVKGGPQKVRQSVGNAHEGLSVGRDHSLALRPEPFDRRFDGVAGL